MRPATLTMLLFVVLGYAANAQKFSLLPQFGVENNFTSLSLNNLNSFAPMGSQISPRLALRMDYQLMKNHGIYMGASTSRSVVEFNFANPEYAMNVFNAERGKTQLRLEGGYKFSSKPIYLTKGKMVSVPSKPIYEKVQVQKRCGGSSGTNYYYKKVTPPPTQVREKGPYVSVQPSLGAAYIPGVNSDLSIKNAASQQTYQYRAGNWNTALVAGTSFEFGANDVKKFVLSLQYLKAMGNLNTNTITTVSNGKESVSTLDSKSSGWNLTAGIPITLGKKKQVAKSVIQQAPFKKEQRVKEEKKCGQSKSRCGRSI